MMNLFKRIPFHPFLFGIYAVLAMLAHNIGQVEVASAFRSLVAIPLGTIIFLLLLRLLLKDWQKASIITSLFVLLFFSFGHVYIALEDVYVFGESLGRYRYLGPLWIALALLGIWWTLNKRRNLIQINQVLNIIAILTLVAPVFQITAFEVRTRTIESAQENEPSFDIADSATSQSLLVPDGEIAPDIYYIILDMYVRDDVMLDIFEYDNSPFLNHLADMGFYVAGCSQSNYTDTPLSIASTFNMAYLESFAGDLIASNLDHYQIEPYVNNSYVLRALKELGYKIVNVESGFFLTEWQDADIYLSGESSSKWRNFAFGGLNNFESMLLHSTVGKWIFEHRAILPETFIPILDQPYIDRRNQILYALDTLENITTIPGPKFVFAHIVAPHPPFVFGPNGEFVVRNTPLTLNFDLEDREWRRYVPGYRGQVIYLNSMFEKIFESILENSSRSPIIILQGDHGITRVSSVLERVAILNAYHLPGGGDELLYPSISPINTFRLIFNFYFGGKFELLQDVSYFWKSDEGPYEFDVIPSTQLECGE
jgi:hypothetical protein